MEYFNIKKYRILYVTRLEYFRGVFYTVLLFNIFLEMSFAMTLDAINEGDDIGGERIGDMKFVDDIALRAEQPEGLQKVLTVVVQVSQKMGMHCTGQECVDGRLTHAMASPGP